VPTLLRTGQLLVAMPTLEDENFHRSVVLLLAHGDEGTLGVVLNRANDVPVATLLPGWEGLVTEPDSVFVGGPVGRSSVIGLARLVEGGEAGFEGCLPVVGRTATIDLNRLPDEIASGVDAVRLFSGHAGWDAGQLEAEVVMGGWFVVPSELEDVFTSDPAGLWRAVLRRQRGLPALYANAPPKLSLN
jgi:putative transcriptional regulator